MVYQTTGRVRESKVLTSSRVSPRAGTAHDGASNVGGLRGAIVAVTVDADAGPSPSRVSSSSVHC